MSDLSDNPPLKTCKTHGALYRDNVIKSGFYESGKPAFKCKACMRELHARHYKINKTKIREANNLYKKENKEKHAAIKKKSLIKNRHKYKERQNYIKKISERVQTEEMSDRYIKKMITKRSNLSMSDVPEEMIKLGRAVLQLKRTLRRKKIDGKNKDD
jgi:hypothetical protein